MWALSKAAEVSVKKPSCGAAAAALPKHSTHLKPTVVVWIVSQPHSKRLAGSGLTHQLLRALTLLIP